MKNTKFMLLLVAILLINITVQQYDDYNGEEYYDGEFYHQPEEIIELICPPATERESMECEENQDYMGKEVCVFFNEDYSNSLDDPYGFFQNRIESNICNACKNDENVELVYNVPCEYIIAVEPIPETGEEITEPDNEMHMYYCQEQRDYYNYDYYHGEYYVDGEYYYEDGEYYYDDGEYYGEHMMCPEYYVDICAVTYEGDHIDGISNDCFACNMPEIEYYMYGRCDDFLIIDPKPVYIDEDHIRESDKEYCEDILDEFENDKRCRNQKEEEFCAVNGDGMMIDHYKTKCDACMKHESTSYLLEGSCSDYKSLDDDDNNSAGKISIQFGVIGALALIFGL